MRTLYHNLNNTSSSTKNEMSLSNYKIQFQKLSEKACLPTRANEGDAGYDLTSAMDVVIPPGKNALVKTDLCVRLPDPPVPGTSVYMQICERSGLAFKKNIRVGAGVIDQGFNGNIGVVLFNHASEDFEVNCGDRVAQAVLKVIMTPCVEEVDNISSEVTERGAGGFGSSGV